MTLVQFSATDRKPTPFPATTRSQTSSTIWSTEMYLMNESLARIHREELRPSDHERRAMRLAAARRLERRAARARQRARRLSLAALTLQHRA